MKRFLFDSNGKFQPIFFWGTVFLTLDAIAFIMRLCGVTYIDNALVLGSMGGVIALVGLYNFSRKK